MIGQGKQFQTKKGEILIGYKEEVLYKVVVRNCQRLPREVVVPCACRHLRSGWRNSEN